MNLTKKLLFIDSQDGTRNYDSTAEDVNYYHPYNISVTLPSPFTNIKRIILKSVEMPVALFNIRNTNKSNLFSVGWTWSGNSYNMNYKIPSGFYSSSANLISNGLANALFSIGLLPAAYRITLSFSTATGGGTGFTVCVLTHNGSSFTINDSYLMNTILGFQSGTYSSSTIYGVRPINIFPDTHLYMYLPNIPTNNYSSKQATFKIPLLNGYATPPNNLYYEDVNEHQAITFNNNNNFILDKLNIIINDKFGYPIIGYLDYSFSLLIEYEENNTQIETINLQY